MDEERMPKVDFKNDPRVTSFTKAYMKRFEEDNKERVQRVITWRKKNNITATFLGFTVLGIYFYTMYAVKQEKFLDDFNEPEKVVQKQVE